MPLHLTDATRLLTAKFQTGPDRTGPDQTKSADFVGDPHGPNVWSGPSGVSNFYVNTLRRHRHNCSELLNTERNTNAYKINSDNIDDWSK